MQLLSIWKKTSFLVKTGESIPTIDRLTIQSLKGILMPMTFGKFEIYKIIKVKPSIL